MIGWKPATPAELVEELKDRSEDGLYFEICSENAKVLYEYIQGLRRDASRTSDEVM